MESEGEGSQPSANSALGLTLRLNRGMLSGTISAAPRRVVRVISQSNNVGACFMPARHPIVIPSDSEESHTPRSRTE